MPTILDVARAAGVSQGTASNVLNGKGNVSSDKVRRVLEAAEQLGYAINERARLLRKGSSRALAAVVPNLYFRQYEDFFTSFQQKAESGGYTANLFTTGDKPESERKLVQALRSHMIEGVAVFSSITDGTTPYFDAGFEKSRVLFIDRRPGFESSFLGFDYTRAGREMAQKAVEAGYRSIAVFTETAAYRDQREFREAFLAHMEAHAPGCLVYLRESDFFRQNLNAIRLFNRENWPEAVFTTNYGLAQTVRTVHESFFPGRQAVIYTMSPLFTLPEFDYQKYELDYRRLGSLAAERLMAPAGAPPQAQTLAGKGFRNWRANIHAKGAKTLNLITLDSPTARALQSLAGLYSSTSGVDVRIAIMPFDSVYDALTNLNGSESYDVIRLDKNWLSWFAEDILVPLEEVDPSVKELFSSFLPGLNGRYSEHGGVVYALPSSPSVQILFYRKDLFESMACRSLYQETHRAELRPPATFAEYNQMARFFTRRLNGASPVEYGLTLTAGNSGMAANEFFTRYFALSQQLFSPEGRLLLNTPQAREALAQLKEAQGYAPASPSQTWTDSARLFAEGKTALTVQFSNYASEMVGGDSLVADRIGWGIIPGGNPLLSGGSLAISRFSKRKQEALNFLRWMSREEVAGANTLLGGVSPCTATYENYEILDTYPWLQLVKQSVAMSTHTRRPPGSARFDDRRFTSILGTAVISVLNNTMEVDEALQYAQRTCEQAFGFPASK